jgi:5-methylcytosine-specific restriction endonuclease McrA
MVRLSRHKLAGRSDVVILRWRFKPAEPRSPAWRGVRRRHLATNPTCAACGTKHLVDVHHIIPFHIDPTHELDPGNLITLCRWPLRRHHFKVGHLGDWTRWNETVRADAAVLLTQRDNESARA